MDPSGRCQRREEALDEYGPQHPMTRALKGKKAGEKFSCPKAASAAKAPP